MATNASSVRCWLAELRYETESYDAVGDGGPGPSALAAVRRQGRASWSPLMLPPNNNNATTIANTRGKISVFVSDCEGQVPDQAAAAAVKERGRSPSVRGRLAPTTTTTTTTSADLQLLQRPPRPHSHQPPPTTTTSALHVFREAPIDRLKLWDAGASRLPRHWRTGRHGLLTEAGLFCATDRNALLAMRSAAALAEGCGEHVDLRGGATITRDLEHVHSAKRNVLVVGAADGTPLALLQCEEACASDAWFCAVHRVLELRGSGGGGGGGGSSSSRGVGGASPGPVARNALARLFKKRPPREALVSQGIIKSESVFGNVLERLWEAGASAGGESGAGGVARRANERAAAAGRVPAFVVRCTELLERPPHVCSVGLYRTSGNLSHIQRLRLCVDRRDAAALDEDEAAVGGDTDVLAGALKLFFRELQTPLLPYTVYTALSQALTDTGEGGERLAQARHALAHLTPAHHSTLACLCTHLLRVTAHESHNQMSAVNLAIVWGPSFTWPEEGAGARALHQCTDVIRVVQYLIEQSPMLFPA